VDLDFAEVASVAIGGGRKEEEEGRIIAVLMPLAAIFSWARGPKRGGT